MNILKYLSIFTMLLAMAACGDKDEPNPDNGGGSAGGGSTPEQKFDIPDQSGMTIKGVVYSGETRLEGVQVSDGYEVTYTDANGVYYLPSKKQNGYVMITNPKGYKVKSDGIYPQFYKTLSGRANSTNVEQYNFELLADDSTNHTVLLLADTHLANQYQDVDQFANRVLVDINTTAKTYRDAGNTVYAITLGDQSFDQYWTSNNWGIPQTKSIMTGIQADALYNCMGNHDHNPDIIGDWNAAADYRKHWGPNYYSFNAGNIHYVVLDNINYTNPQGFSSDTRYVCTLVPEVVEWFKKDLSTVDKSTPLVVCMHAPLFANMLATSSGADSAAKFHYDFGPTFEQCVSGFSNVTVVSGHLHNNSSTAKGAIREYNIAAVCAIWWWTGQNSFTPKNHICKDGSVGGYRVLEVKGNDIQTYYKSTMFDRDYQFRSYDLNNCYITPERFCPGAKNASELTPWLINKGFGYTTDVYNADGSAKRPNRVLINIFGYDSRWKVEVTEEGKALTAKRVNAYDPYFIISGAACRLKAGASLANSTRFDPKSIGHFFEVTASSPTSTLDIKVTDPFGRTYTEKMIRPKTFDIESYLPAN